MLKEMLVMVNIVLGLLGLIMATLGNKFSIRVHQGAHSV